MKPARFGYHRVGSVREAVETLTAYEGTARILAGGQSLVPMLNMRLLRPDALVDVNDVAEIRRIEDTGGGVRIGAAVRYRELETSSLIAEKLPLVVTTLQHVGDRQIRNRGTIGGSLVQGDPTGEMPLTCLLLGAQVTVTGPQGGRTVPLSEFYVDSYATVLDPLEMVTDVYVPAAPGPAAFLELCRRHNDFAVLSVASVGCRNSSGRWEKVALGLGGVAATPVLVPEAAERLSGSSLTDDDIDAAASLALDAIDPPTDVRASAEYRRHLTPIYVRRALNKLREEAA